MTEHDFAYLAGLIDGEGSIYYKRTKQKRNTRPGKPIHNVWVIRIEIAMTSEDTLKWCHETFKCGSFGERKVKKGLKRQWRWRVSHRDALEIALAVWPYMKNKLHKIEQIIDENPSSKEFKAIFADGSVDLITIIDLSIWSVE